MVSIELTAGDEPIELDIDDRFIELLEEVNEAIVRDISLEGFAAQTIRHSAPALEQAIERSIVGQHQAIREAEQRDVELEQLAQAWDAPGE